MNKTKYTVRKDLEPFVNCIMIGENADPQGELTIPLYADGFPGIMFQQCENGFYLLPKNKRLSELFLYGQTLDPVSLQVKGPYNYVVFQLYPFASNYLLGVDPRELNDECFDLLQLDHINVEAYKDKLILANNLEDQIEIISDLMIELISLHRITGHDGIQKAIHTILKNRGQITIKELIEEIHITERTLERNFLTQVGLTPKQFARIIQFQYSLSKLTEDNFDKLTEISADSGFSDQSHFIRTFKKYTGQTPSYYLKHTS